MPISKKGKGNEYRARSHAGPSHLIRAQAGGPQDLPHSSTQQDHESHNTRLGTSDLQWYREVEQERSEYTTTNGLSNRFTAQSGTVQNGKADDDVQIDFGKLAASSSNAARHGDQVKHQSHGPFLKEAGPLQGTVNPRGKKRLREEVSHEEAGQRLVSFLRDLADRYETESKDHHYPSSTGTEPLSRLRMLKNAATMPENKSRLLGLVAAMSDEDTAAYTSLIEGYTSHKESLSLGHTRPISTFEEYPQLHRGAVFWTPTCQRALNPNAVLDERRIPSRYGLIDDTKRMVVVIAVDKHHLRVCPVTTRNNNGGNFLHNRASWAQLQGPDIPVSQNLGLPVFKMDPKASNHRATSIHPKAVFKTDVHMEVQPPADYDYVGRLDADSTDRLPLPVGFDSVGNVMDTKVFRLDDRTESGSHLPRTTKQWDIPATSKREDSHSTKRTKMNQRDEAYRRIPPPTSQPSHNGRRNTFQGNARPSLGLSNSGSIRVDIDDPGHKDKDDELNYG